MGYNILSDLKNFDEFIAIDWSGAKLPIRNPKIAVAQFDFNSYQLPILPRDRWSRHEVYEYFISLASLQSRILIGIDCNFGWCHEIGKQVCGDDYSAPAIWRLVDEVCQNEQNFCAEGFWQHPKYQSLFWTKGLKPDWFNQTKLQRRIELICGEKNLGYPESPFKLIGTKQVGKGGMAGMRLLHQLKQSLGNKMAVWPFDSADDINNATIVITEIYPRLFWKMTGLGHKKITTQDLLQRAVHELYPTLYVPNDIHLSDDQSDALISALGLSFLCGQGKYIPNNIAYPKELEPLQAKTEGWIFGV